MPHSARESCSTSSLALSPPWHRPTWPDGLIQSRDYGATFWDEWRWKKAKFSMVQTIIGLFIYCKWHYQIFWKPKNWLTFLCLHVSIPMHGDCSTLKIKFPFSVWFFKKVTWNFQQNSLLESRAWLLFDNIHFKMFRSVPAINKYVQTQKQPFLIEWMPMI